MKTVFLIVSKAVIRRNIYDTDFWQTFLDNTGGMQKVLIVPPDDVENITEAFGDTNVVVEAYQKVSWHLWSKFVMFLVRAGVNSHSTLVYRKRAYARKTAGVIQSYIKGFVAHTLGSSNTGKHLVRVLVAYLPTSQPLKDLFEQYKPSAIFAPSLIDTDFDVPISIEARKRGIKVVGMVRSWDNLNNHGLLPFVPDHFIVQNSWLIEAAQKFQAISKKNLPKDVVGLPHYDIYFDPSKYLKPREEFMEHFGLDPNKRFVLLGGSDFYYSEDVLPKLLDDAIEKEEIQKPLQVVFRPHPASLFSHSDYGLDELSHVKLDDAFSGKKKFSDTEKFVNLIFHADIVINISSTLSVDAAVFDTPAICVKFDDPNRKLSYYEKVDRLYDMFDHYERLVSTGGVRTPESPEALIHTINEYLEDSTLDSTGRKKIVEEFVSPFDGQAGKRLGEIVSEYVIENK
ncbi:hypothetical protein N8083_00170 [Candidatus Pacebacteria bacterium]|nr:hypothetical protein [Candidatus Paceibacterota bacterium]